MQSFYSCRNFNGGTPNIIAKTIAAAYTTAILDGFPVIAVAAGNVERAGQASNLVTATSILGFANADRRSGGTLPAWIAAIPPVNDLPSGLELINVNLATPTNIHTLPLKSDQSPAQTDIGVACDIGYDDVNDTYYLHKSSATNALVRITEIRHDMIGVLGGLVDFVVLDAKSQAPGGDVAV